MGDEYLLMTCAQELAIDVINGAFLGPTSGSRLCVALQSVIGVGTVTPSLFFAR